MLRMREEKRMRRGEGDRGGAAIDIYMRLQSGRFMNYHSSMISE